MWGGAETAAKQEPAGSSQTGKARVALCGSCRLFRDSLAQVLANEPDLEVVAKCSSLEEMLSALASRPVDVTLLIAPPGEPLPSAFFEPAWEGGFQGRVLVVAAALNPAVAMQLIRLGAVGFLRTEDPPEALAQSIRRAMSGEAWLDQQHLRALAEAFAQGAEKDLQSALVETRPKLTTREQAVLRYVVNGLSNRDIARKLNLSEESVKSAMQRLFAKAGVRTRSGLVRIALQK